MIARGPVTLLDVAQRAGVSLATASRVINGSDRRVSAALRERVTAAADELRYVRNAYAQALARSRTSIAGIIVYDIGHPYFAGIIRGMQRVAADAGQIVLICNSNRDRERETAYVTLLHEHRAATIVMAAAGDGEDYRRRLEARLTSFVEGGGHAALIGRYDMALPAVVPDSVGGMRALGTELIRLGHRRIAVISGPADLMVVQDRLTGLNAALADGDVPLAGAWVVEGDLHREGGAAGVRELFARGLAPTAIVAVNDEMAIGAMGELRRRGMRIPSDISVAGFDDIPIANDVDPPLTTVRVPLEDVGACAMRLALRCAGPGAVVEPLATELVVRGSTAAPP